MTLVPRKGRTTRNANKKALSLSNPRIWPILQFFFFVDKQANRKKDKQTKKQTDRTKKYMSPHLSIQGSIKSDGPWQSVNLATGIPFLGVGATFGTISWPTH